MKITRRQLRRLIKEELIRERWEGHGRGGDIRLIVLGDGETYSENGWVIDIKPDALKKVEEEDFKIFNLQQDVDYDIIEIFGSASGEAGPLK